MIKYFLYSKYVLNFELLFFEISHALMNVYIHIMRQTIEKVDSFKLLTIILLNKISLNTIKTSIFYIIHNINQSI